MSPTFKYPTEDTPDEDRSYCGCCGREIFFQYVSVLEEVGEPDTEAMRQTLKAMRETKEWCPDCEAHVAPLRPPLPLGYDEPNAPHNRTYEAQHGTPCPFHV